jgi:hypothetical protein
LLPGVCHGAGDGIVNDGLIAPIPGKFSIEQTAKNLNICSTTEMIDQLQGWC